MSRCQVSGIWGTRSCPHAARGPGRGAGREGEGCAAAPPAPGLVLRRALRFAGPPRRNSGRGGERRGGMLPGKPRHRARGAPGPEAGAARPAGASARRGVSHRAVRGAMRDALRGRTDGQTRSRFSLLPAHADAPGSDSRTCAR